MFGIIIQEGNMKKKQVKSKKRVEKYGEVQTAEEEVSAMLENVRSEMENINSIFFEPACGEGPFLSYCLKQRMSFIENMFNDNNNADEAWKTSVCVAAISSLFGMDMLEDNVEICKKHMFAIWMEYVEKILQTSISSDLSDIVRNILANNIVVGNVLENREKYSKMDISVICANPPYNQKKYETGTRSVIVYDKFVDFARDLNPKYITMIIPSRWFTNDFGIKTFRESMLNDDHIFLLEDFVDSRECFGERIEIYGGVCYFLWSRDYHGQCVVRTHINGYCSESIRSLKPNKNGLFIRWNEAISILKKVQFLEEPSFSFLVSSLNPYGIPTTFHGRSEIRGGDIILYENGGQTYIAENEVPRATENITDYSVYVSAGYGGHGKYPHQIIGNPIVSNGRSVCTETYIQIGPFKSQNEAENASSYIQTRFFRFMVSLVKNSQHASRKVYALVPIQDFSKSWTDTDLYKKYLLSDSEIEFIERIVK